MNYYEELEVSVKASPVVIKAAYKAQAKQYHPDIYRGDPRFAAQKLKNLNSAYEILSDPQKRQEYDYLNKIDKQEKNYNSYSEKTNYNQDNNNSNTYNKPKKILDPTDRIAIFIFIILFIIGYIAFSASFY